MKISSRVFYSTIFIKNINCDFVLQRILWFFVLSALSVANGYKILFLVPFPGPSHWFLLQNFAKELVNRGHEVTAVVNKPIANFKSSNYTEILINPPFDFSTICK